MTNLVCEIAYTGVSFGNAVLHALNILFLPSLQGIGFAVAFGQKEPGGHTLPVTPSVGVAVSAELEQ